MSHNLGAVVTCIQDESLDPHHNIPRHSILAELGNLRRDGGAEGEVKEESKEEL